MTIRTISAYCIIFINAALMLAIIPSIHLLAEKRQDNFGVDKTQNMENRRLSYRKWQEDWIKSGVERQIMERGSSAPWSDVLFQTIGENRLDGSALREYFRPLEDWLRNENLRTQEFVGWVYDGDYCKQSIETAGLQVYGGFYNPASRIVLSLAILVLGLCASINSNFNF